jgi:glycine/D-amino acid oxidase-like deaminating enzyme/nitrite reductase/ring-hydroxylating ferredoxin subunit
MSESGATTSIWHAAIPPVRTSPLDTDIEAEVCVVGAGIAGLTTALLLGRAGKRVVVLERYGAGGGMMGRSTGHLTNALDDRYHVIERLHGPEAARLAAVSHTHAIDRIEEIARTEQIACEFERVDGYLILPMGHSVDALLTECEAALRAGIVDASIVERAPYVGFESGPALHFPGQAQMHPMKYVAGLVQACERLGVRVCTDTPVVAFEPNQVRTRDRHMVRFEDIVVATNSPVIDRVTLHTKQHARLTYVIGALVPRGSVPRVLCCDTFDPYHYVRVQSGGADGEQPTYDLLFVGGEDHATGLVDNGSLRFSRLETWMRDRFDMAGEVLYRWSGQVLEPIDRLAFIGRNPTHGRGVYVITGYSGNGLTHATLGATIISDMVLGVHNPWTSLYEPSRMTMGAAGEWVREGVSVASHYGDWLTPGDVDAVDDLAFGQGAVVRRGLTKVAVWRRPDGTVVQHSAVCTHMGGIVHWNSTDQTWDCPCHGSRFNCTGRVFQGPANRDFAELEVPLEAQSRLSREE